MEQVNMNGAEGTKLIPPAQDELDKKEVVEKAEAEKEALEKKAKLIPKGSKSVVGKVFMMLPSGGELTKGKETILCKEDYEHLHKAFGEGVKHLVE